jgi:hypothetical protein
VRRYAPTIVVLALLIGTAVAFAETERLKLQPTPIEESFVEPAFSPVCNCATAKAAIRLWLHRADTVTVRILDSADTTVRRLGDRRLPRGRTQLAWDGHTNTGARAADGSYRVEAHLGRADRTFRLPNTIVLDTVAPEIRLVSHAARVRLGQRVRISYRVNEAAHGVLYVNGVKGVGPTYTKNRAATLQWQPRRAGRFRLQLAAVDLAGNRSHRSPVFVVHVTS